MKREIAQLWAKELRCGNWEQGEIFLEHSETYCVLGILANIAASFGICDKNSNSGHVYIFDGEMLHLPESVQKWAELRHYPSQIKEWNDKGKKFKFLADHIDKNWEEL